MHTLSNIIIKPLTALALVSLCQCGVFSNKGSRPSAEDVTSTVTPNRIDSNAIHFKARYGTEYEIQGNVIAEYPDFNLSLHKTTIDKNKNIISTYKFTSKSDDNVSFLDVESEGVGRKHFYLEGSHFYYHSNKPQTINIYMPPQLLAFSMIREQ